MKKYFFAVTINDATAADAALARDEVAQSLQDAKDSGILPQVDFDVSYVVPNDAADDNDTKVIEAARGEHAVDGELEIDDNAVVSYSTDGGAYVQAWVWVGNSAIHAAGAVNPETDLDTSSTTVTHLPGDPVRELEMDISEGGHCD